MWAMGDLCRCKFSVIYSLLWEAIIELSKNVITSLIILFFNKETLVKYGTEQQKKKKRQLPSDIVTK